MTSRRFEYHAPIVELPGGYKVYSNEFVQLVRDCWPYGFVDDGGTPTAAAIMYTTGYALKEDEFSNDHEQELSELWCWEHHKYSETASTPKHLLKLKPFIPFRRFSLRPGLGLDEDTVKFVYKYMYNDGINFRFSIDLGQGFVVPIPGIYLDKFAAYNDGDATFSELCKAIRKDAFDNEMQSDLCEAYERSGGSDELARTVRGARIKKRLDTKINNLLSQTSNIYRHEI